MVRVITLLLMLIGLLIGSTECKLGAVLNFVVPTTTLKCMASQGIVNVMLLHQLSPYGQYYRELN